MMCLRNRLREMMTQVRMMREEVIAVVHREQLVVGSLSVAQFYLGEAELALSMARGAYEGAITYDEVEEEAASCH